MNIRDESDGTHQYFAIDGALDESSLFDVSWAPATTVMIIDTGGVNSVNGGGRREWQKFVAAFSALDVVLVNASEWMVDQINQFDNFLGHAKVRSVRVPYRCARCNEDYLRTSDASVFAARDAKKPTQRCDKCDGVLDFAGDSAKYFAFAQRPNVLVTDHSLDQVIAKLMARAVRRELNTVEGVQLRQIQSVTQDAIELPADGDSSSAQGNALDGRLGQPRVPRESVRRVPWDKFALGLVLVIAAVIAFYLAKR